MQKLLLFLSLFTTTLLFAKPVVAVSVLPQQAFVEKIAGDNVDVLLMVAPGNSPHSYEPKPSQMISLSKAELYLSIGVEFEHAWLGRFASQNKNLRIVNISDGIAKLALAEHHHEKEAHHDAHEHEDDEDGLDPHTWTAPNNVKIMAHAIYEALVSIDKEHESAYKQNLENFLAEISQTQVEIKTLLKNTPKETKFLVFHPSWGYFAHEFDLEQVAIEVEGKEPKPRDIIEILKTAKEQDIQVLFVQPEFSDKSAKIIANEGNLRVVKSSPLAYDWSLNLINMARAIAK